MANDIDSILKSSARWTGFISGVLTALLGIIHICYSKAHIVWPTNQKFTNDVNEVPWRLPLFSLDPDIFFDEWTPFVMGFIAWLIHFESFKCTLVLGNFFRFFIWNFVMGLFATIGYRGGLGILFSIPVWLCCLLSVIALIKCDDSADLNIAWRFWEKREGTPPSTVPAT